MKTAYLIAGLGYGDEGKGATVDFLCRQTQARLVVRYNGGPQAAHNVVAGTIHHTFSQFGSASLLPEVWTLLSRYMLVNPLNMMREAEVLEAKGITVLNRTAVSEKSLLITPFQVALSRAKAALRGNHNSCGQGVGQAREDHFRFEDSVPFIGDIGKPKILRSKLEFMQSQAQQEFKGTLQRFPVTYEDIEPIAASLERWLTTTIVCDDLDFLHSFKSDSVVFEGAQGVLLDETFGEPGFNTWTDCTFRNAFALVCGRAQVNRIGVSRTYHTRHGDGPFLAEDCSLKYAELHNGNGNYQGRFRVGRFDPRLASRAISILGGIDYLALNHLDITATPEDALKAPLIIEGRGPRAEDRTWKL
jgi:adenylosuccinate synthase